MSYCIYGIIDPRCDRIFYVGHTRNFARRRSEHLEGTETLSGLQVRQIKENGFVPLFVRLEDCRDETAALSAEIFWIELLKSRGVELANAQNFEGYEARGQERRCRQSVLSQMQNAKLRTIADGKPARETAAWTARDLARLRGMAREKMSLAAMADALERSIGAIRKKLTSLDRGKQPTGQRHKRPTGQLGKS